MENGLNTLHTVSLVLSDMLIRLAVSSTANKNYCNVRHDGASKTMSPAYANKGTRIATA